MDGSAQVLPGSALQHRSWNLLSLLRLLARLEGGGSLGGRGRGRLRAAVGRPAGRGRGLPRHTAQQICRLAAQQQPILVHLLSFPTERTARGMAHSITYSAQALCTPVLSPVCHHS